MSVPQFHVLEDILRYLAQFTDYEKMLRYSMKRGEFDLGRVERFFNALGAPQSAYEVVHVAGTKGKGSVTTLIDQLLRAQGVSSARYTSPHLERINERISIGGHDISDQAFCAAFTEMATELVRVQASGDQQTFFELLTAAALIAFRQARIKIAVLETGLGGRLDATNVSMPALTVITNIGHDHHDKLGDELTDIAYEKAGIIKPTIPLITGSYDHDALAVVLAKARDLEAPVRRYRHDFEALNIQSGPHGITFSLRSKHYRLEDLALPLFGAHQAVNAAMAVESLYWLREAGVLETLDEDALRSGLANMKIAGRFEVFHFEDEPSVVLDVAHNEESIRAFAKTLRQQFGDAPLSLVFAIARDKEIEPIVEMLADLGGHTFLTTFPSPRVCPLEVLKEQWSKFSATNVTLEPDPKAALKHARRLTPSNGVVAVVGSFYLVGDVRGELTGALTQKSKE